VAKLKAEIKYEKESSVEIESKEPQFIQDLKSEGVWTLHDKPSQDEITLTRDFGNEKIRIIFSIADLDTDMNNEEEMEDEDEDEDGEVTKKKKEGSDDENDDYNQSYPVRTAITITKTDHPGALNIDAVAQDGMFMVENISYYADSKLAMDLTGEADWQRRGLYVGPQFHHLDDGVQEDFETYLNERNIDPALALIIPDIAQWKEQKEYVTWLNGVQQFIKV